MTLVYHQLSINPVEHKCLKVCLWVKEFTLDPDDIDHLPGDVRGTPGTSV